MLPSVSVILPAFNEGACITSVVEQALPFLTETFAWFEVIVVDDGSTDDTAQRVAALQARSDCVRLLRHEGNRGYGAALRTGFDAASGDLVFFTDADAQFDIRELAGLLPLLAGADAVFGYRLGRADSWVRRVCSRGYNRLVRVWFGVRVRDVDCAFKLFTRRVVDRLEFDSRDFFVDTELVARTARLGFTIAEYGVHHYPRRCGRSSVRPSDVPRTLWTALRAWLRPSA
ncbi:MAG: glycosyltransferase family 2 protein [Planctomycetes bacterium]|nr:glycosyltransferase family 2 protein [Planctomycetota bacterium]